MHIVVDVIAGLLLAFAFWSGWHKGFLLSLLGIIRVATALVLAWFGGRYLGFWLGTALHRPRIITIPVTASLCFFLVSFAFTFLTAKRKAERKRKRKEDEDYHPPLFDCLLGGILNLAAGVPVVILVFWLVEFFVATMTNTTLPGMKESYTGRFAHRAIYQVVRYLLPETLEASRRDCLARAVAMPAVSIETLEKIFSAPSVVAIRYDEHVLDDILSNDPDRIAANPSIRMLMEDVFTMRRLRDLGIISDRETRRQFCRRLAALGKNPRIRESIQRLRQRNMLQTDKLSLLLRDPDVDIIVGELLDPTTAAEESLPAPTLRPARASGE